MQRTYVKSSNLASVGYDKETKTLEIAFGKSGVYRFRNVPESVYKGLMAAPSKGKYFNAHIKGAFPTTKVV